MEFQNTLKPGESGSFLFELNEIEADKTPLPRKYLRFEIPSDKIKLSSKYYCDRAEVIVFGETLAYQKDDPITPVLIFGSLAILMLFMGVRLNYPPVWFKWKHNLMAFMFSITMLVVNYYVEISRLTPYPNDISEAVLMLLIIYGFVGIGALIFSGIVGCLHGLLLNKLKKSSSD